MKRSKLEKIVLEEIKKNSLKETANRFKSLSAVDVKRIIDKEYKEAQRVFGKAVDTRPTEEDYAAAEEYVKKKHGDKWHVEAIGINKTKNKIYIEAFENFTRSKHANFEDRRNKEHIIDRPKGIKESVNEVKKNKIIVWTDRNKKKQTIDLDASQLERAVSSGHDNDWNWNIDRIKQHIDRGEKEGTTDITRYDGGRSDTVYWESINEAAAPKFTAKEFVAYVNDEFDSETLQLMKSVLDERLKFLDKMQSMANPRTTVQGYMRKDDLKEIVEESIGSEVQSIILEVAEGFGYKGTKHKSATVTGLVSKVLPGIPKKEKKSFLIEVTRIQQIYGVDEIIL